MNAQTMKSFDKGPLMFGCAVAAPFIALIIATYFGENAMKIFFILSFIVGTYIIYKTEQRGVCYSSILLAILCLAFLSNLLMVIPFAFLFLNYAKTKFES